MSTRAVRWLMQATGQPMSPVECDLVPADDEVVVAVAGCGVCHTDLGFYYDGVRPNHALPLCLGHEISGIVTDAGAGAASWRDRAVIVPAVMPCGVCEACQRGKMSICPNQKMPGNDLHGGFATHVVVPARGLCPVDPRQLAAAGLDLAAVSVVADAVTTPYQAIHQCGVQAGDLVIVNGVGGVGSYCAQIAHALGATVVAIDVNDDKLRSMAEGTAALTLNAGTSPVRELKATIQTFAKERGLRHRSDWFVFECSGTRAGQETAFGLLNHGATLSIVGFTMEKVQLRLSNLMAYHARALGNWGCAPQLYPAALDLVLSGRVHLGPFVEKFPLATINDVFAAVHAGRIARRPILVPSLDPAPAT